MGGRPIVFDEIQQIVDEVADDLRRPVVLEDEPLFAAVSHDLCTSITALQLAGQRDRRRRRRR